MPTSHENALQQRCQQIVTSPVLSPEQKRHFLALEAENNLPYPQLPAEARRALDEGVICDMFEGHAPYKPRYVLPDYARFLANGSEWLELEGAKDLDDALSLLTILYHHVPSVTSMPVYLGQLDALLQPYVRILTQDEIDVRINVSGVTSTEPCQTPLCTPISARLIRPLPTRSYVQTQI